MFHYLIGRGESGEEGVLGRMASASNLVQRVHPEDTREVRLFGYRGPYTINPTFRSALERLVAEDPDLPQR